MAQRVCETAERGDEAARVGGVAASPGRLKRLPRERARADCEFALRACGLPTSDRSLRIPRKPRNTASAMPMSANGGAGAEPGLIVAHVIVHEDRDDRQREDQLRVADQLGQHGATPDEQQAKPVQFGTDDHGRSLDTQSRDYLEIRASGISIGSHGRTLPDRCMTILSARKAARTSSCGQLSSF